VQKPAGQSGPGGTTRIAGGEVSARATIHFNPDTQKAIDLMMTQDNVGLTEAVRRLIAYGNYIYRAITVDGSDILIREGSSTREVVLIR
jgi:hypothetical protein